MVFSFLWGAWERESLDNYLLMIYQNIRYYWQGQPGDDDWDGESLTPPSAADGIMSPE